MIIEFNSFEWFRDKTLFIQKWSELFDELKSNKILAILGVFDNIDNNWFEDAPMLVCFSNGNLAVWTKSFCETAVTWNIIDYRTKPEWYSSVILKSESDFLKNWKEDLEWVRYEKLSDFFDSKIISIEPIENSDGIVGIKFITESGNFVVADNGDVTAGFYEKDYDANVPY